MRESDNNVRRIVIRFIVAAVFLVLLFRVAKMQFFNEEFTDYAESLVRVEQTVYPTRGDIYDRNGEFLAQSRECYDLMVTYDDLEDEGFDTMRLCSLIDIDKQKLIKSLSRIKKDAYMRLKPVKVIGYVTKEAKLQLEELSIPGFSFVSRTIRWYPRKIAGNVLGYLSEVNEQGLKSDPYYELGDYLGETALERSYEKVLRGEKGVEVLIKDSKTVIQGAYMEGQYDKVAIPGKDIVCTIDGRLQAFAEELLVGKVGAVVAIEPSTGEVLVMASSPGYNPDDLLGRERGNNYMKLLNTPTKPLNKRAIDGKYHPGSVFKLVQGLIALQEGVLYPEKQYPCHGGYTYGKNKKLGCHAHPSPLSLQDAVAHSCNAYFCHVFTNILNNRTKYKNTKEAYEAWREYILSFGFGRKLGIDIAGEDAGYIHTVEKHDADHRHGWGPTNIISISIGQVVECTPLQIANLAAIIANRGHYYIPHLVKSVEGEESIDKKYLEPQYVKVEPRHFEPIVEGMWRSVNRQGGGTSRIAYIPGLDVCGKTGTAQNSVRGKLTKDDHSVFLTFAPRNNPKIAMAVYIEHGGSGSSIAAPIASLVEEMYLTDTVVRHDLVRMVKSRKIDYSKYYKAESK